MYAFDATTGQQNGKMPHLAKVLQVHLLILTIFCTAPLQIQGLRE